MKNILLIFFILLTESVVISQKRVGVIGSSTAYGLFPNYDYPRDSSWAFKLKKHYIDLGKIDTLYNIATPGIDCYTTMPTGYTPPPGRNKPDTNFNITKICSFSPKPTSVIINLPSNNYEWLSNEEIINCLQIMKHYANERGIRCYITTSQPRNDFNSSEREKLKTIATLIKTTFSVYAIDFWTDIVQDPPIILLPMYNYGDGVHLNPAGHTVLKNKVIEKDILSDPVNYNSIHLQAQICGENVKLIWNNVSFKSSSSYIINRKFDDNNFQSIAVIPVKEISPENNTYTFKEHLSGNKIQYKIEYKYDAGMIQSNIIAITNPAQNTKVFPQNVKNFLNIKHYINKLSYTIYDISGRKYLSYYRNCFGNDQHQINVSKLKRGMYYIRLNTENATYMFIKL